MTLVMSTEWKVEKDRPNDLHRHLSHLVGLYPSYSIASYPEGGEVMGLTRKALLEATRTTLRHRGDGRGPDADAGMRFPSFRLETSRSLTERNDQGGKRCGERRAGHSLAKRTSFTPCSRCVPPCSNPNLLNATSFALQYAVFENFGDNLFSLYDPRSFDPIFQIDANLGVPGVLMVMCSLVQILEPRP